MHARVVDPAGRVRSGRVSDDGIDVGEAVYPLDEITWLPPAQPSKIVCLARNVAAHAAEHDADVPERPSYFLKPPSALAAHEGTVTIPAAIDAVEYEAELVAVIGHTARAVSESDALDHVAGLTCMNDLSNRADQRRELNWVRGKAFDGAAPLGPGLVDVEAVSDDASIELAIDGDVRQQGSRNEYEFDLATVIADCSRYLTLEPGDVIALGTTAGVGPVEDGATIEIRIDGIPPLRHAVSYGR